MGLDIRWPIGLMFSLIGAMLVVYGLVKDVSIDKCWGLVLLVFGALMLTLAWRGSKAAPTDAPADPAKPREPANHP